MKRFYEKTEAGPVEFGFTVLLDGRPIKTPAKAAFTLPNEKMATAIAEEWDAQKIKVNPESMPFMQYAATAIDRVTTQRQVVIDEIAGFGGTDLLCYRASYPDRLVEKQSLAWDPLLLWLDETYSIALETTPGLDHVAQAPQSLASMKAVIEQQNDMKLAAIHTIVSLTGSLVVTLAVIAGRLTAELAFDVSELDETHTIEEWGEQEEASIRRKNNKASLIAATKFLNLCDQ
ncbi:MAG: ATP12 family protein [Sneathiella sp.]